MDIYKILPMMDQYANLDESSMKNYLLTGHHVLIGYNNNYGDIIINYDFYIDDDVLFVGKLSDSTLENMEITLEMAALYSDELFSSLYLNYISSENDLYLVDTKGYLYGADINSGMFDLSTLKNNIKPGEIITFNDVNSPAEGIINMETKIYIIDNPDAIMGEDAIKEALANVTGAKITDDKMSSDMIILVLPTAAKTVHKNFYEWLSPSNQKVPAISETLKKNNLSFLGDKPILLNWTSNVVMAGIFNSNNAFFQACSELEQAIKKINKKK